MERRKGPVRPVCYKRSAVRSLCMENVEVFVQVESFRALQLTEATSASPLIHFLTAVRLPLNINGEFG